MSNELNDNEKRDIVSNCINNMENLSFPPVRLEDGYDVSAHTKVPLTKIAALGVAFEPVSAAIQRVISGPGATSGLYKVTIPSEAHLAAFKSGVGYLGSYLDVNNQLAGQAVLTPLKCNPAMIFLAVTLISLDYKLNSIIKLQKKILNHLVQKEQAEARGNLNILFEILDLYKFKWNDYEWKNINRNSVSEIRRAAEQKIIFYRSQILSTLDNRSVIHLNGKVRRLAREIKYHFNEYQLALYTYGYSYFLEVVLDGMFEAGYLKTIKQKIKSHSKEYSDLYAECYAQLEKYADNSIQSWFLKLNRSGAKILNRVVSILPSPLERIFDLYAEIYKLEFDLIALTGPGLTLENVKILFRRWNKITRAVKIKNRVASRRRRRMKMRMRKMIKLITKGDALHENRENLNAVVSDLQKSISRMKKRNLRMIEEHQSSCVRPFIEHIEIIDRAFNKPLEIIFDREDIYLDLFAQKKAENFKNFIQVSHT